jgi:hypothetical protein
MISSPARAAGAFALAGVLALGAVALDAASCRRRAAEQVPVVLAVAARLPSPDLALAGGARWLRSPSRAEPGAPFDLGPAMLDPDPAGGLLAPPREVWTQEARDTARARGAP